MSKYTQDATYWSPSTLNEYGEQSFSAPVTFKVRWEEKSELYIEKDTGKELRSHSIVYTQTDIEDNGFFYLGTSVSLNPRDVANAYLIKRVENIKALKANKYTRKIWL